MGESKYPKQSIEFYVNCNLGITCINQWGCNKENMFETFIERHKCIINSSKLSHDSRKVIINPDFVEYQFVHYTDTIRILNQQQNKLSPFKYIHGESDEVLKIDLNELILCNHMKEKRDVLKHWNFIKNSIIMDNMIDYFKHYILNESNIYNSISSINTKSVLPYIKDSFYLCD